MKASLAAAVCATIAIIGALSAEDVAKAVSIETDHGASASDISTDELILIRSDGSKESITRNGWMERVPMLSHDSSTIAFLRRRDSTGDGTVNWNDKGELWIMHLENRTEFHVAENLTEPSQATWHPKKKTFAFIATDMDLGRGLYSYDVASKTHKRLSDKAEAWPAWSANGDFIAFYDAQNRIVLFCIADGDYEELTKPVGNSWALYWSTDNNLVFMEKSKWRIYTHGAKQPNMLDASQLKRQTIIDQRKFDWALATTEPTTAEQATSQTESQ